MQLLRDLVDELLHAKVKAKLFGGDHAPKLGRLAILERLGAGAMGTVFAAYDPRLERKVAVKVLRSGDSAMTVMVVNKVLSGSTALSLLISNFQTAGTARVYRLTSDNKIRHLADRTVSGGTLSDTVPPQSITLYVLPKAS